METIAIHGRCWENGKPFRVIFVRDGGHYYRVHEVRSGSTLSAAVPQAFLLESGLAKSNRDAAPRERTGGTTEVSIWELDWDGAACPHCDDAAGQMEIVECGVCGGLMCGDGGRSKVTCRHCNTQLRVGAGIPGRGSLSAVRITAPVSGAPALPPGRGLLGSAKRLLRRGRDGDD